MKRPPNMRVQRTRAARFARIGSPLTRHPLGALRNLWFLLTLCASLPVFADTTVALVVGVPNPGPCPFECAFLNHVVSGSSFDLVVVAEGQSGGTNPSYTGTVTFRSTDPLASLPPPYTFTTGDQ